MTIKEFKITDLREYENNPRHNENAVDAVAASIREFGFKVPIIIDRNNIIVAGHTRLKAAQKLDLDKVPCIVADDLTPEQIKAFRVADNKTAELAEWDFGKLETELAELAELDFAMEQFGFDELNDDAPAEIIEDDVPDVDEESEPTTQTGDIWQLGRHRLMCGDSTDKNAVETLVNGEIINLVFTDPPYGIDIVKHTGKIGGDKPITPGQVVGTLGGNHIAEATKYRPIKGDDTTDTARLNYEIVKEISENQILFGGNYFTDFLPPKACWLVWDKVNGESVFADVELAWSSFDKGAKLYKFMWNGMARQGSREIEGVKRVHPTQKPVGLIADILRDFSNENDIILDCFGGSGSTLIACEQTNRKCFMMEYEPYYVDVIIQRWETLTGEKAVRLNDVIN